MIDGRYLIEGILGEGGMGVVYRGRHRIIDKRVAIKVLRDELAKDRDMLDRFFNEARAASSIGSPHIVDIADFGMLPDGAAYFVMEYLEGHSLASVLDQHRVLPAAHLVGIARQIAVGLSAAHAAGIVHRDLKPDNVMLIARPGQPNFVKVLDFGIAKMLNAASRLTRTGSVFGTPHYMSPEQAAGLSVDSRADVYALGIILYEMACGNVPFDADNYMGILTQHMYKAPAPPRALAPSAQLPPALEAIILKCLSKKPEGRYQTMDLLVADLDLLAFGQVPVAVGDLLARSGSYDVPADYFQDGGTIPALTSPPSPRRPWGTIAGIAGVFVSIASVVVIIVVAKAGRAAVEPAPLVSEPPIVAPSSSVAPAPRVVAAPARRTIQLAVRPESAQVQRDGVVLVVDKSGSVHLELGPHDEVTLVVSKPGYATQTVKLDASSGGVERVELRPAAPAGPTGKGPWPGKPGAPIKPRTKPALCYDTNGNPSPFANEPECR